MLIRWLPNPDRTAPQAPLRPAARRLGRWAVAGAALAVLGAAVWAWRGLRSRSDPDRLWVKAESAFLAGRWDEASATLQRIGRLRAKTSLDWVLQAQLDAAHGRTDDALRALARVPDGDPMAAQAALLAGRLERARNRFRAAEIHFRHALRIDPGLVEAHKELIYIFGVQLRRREVDAEFRALARRTRLTPFDLFTWAQTHFTVWGPEITTTLQTIVDADPDDRPSRLALAEALLPQPGQAARVARLLDALPASDADALALRVGLALHLGQIDEAEALLRRGPEDHPGLARYRGRLAMARKDFQAAVAHFRAALGPEPYNRTANFELGQALALSGDREGSAPFLERVRMLDEFFKLINRFRSPSREKHPHDLTRIAAASEAAGLIEEARHWYALAVARDPLDAQAQQGLYRLERKDPGS
jgi:tetratricopeptide (TPR) repeat protein